MDDDLRRTLFDPGAARDLVLHHRPAVPTAVEGVVSDVVWGEVVRLLRWATAGTGGSPALWTGTLWRLAAGCADFLRRYPGLSAELAQPWDVVPLPDLTGTGAQRVAAEVDALGEAAVTALAEGPFPNG